MTAPTSVDFHFDIMCPYTYQTSIWMREVQRMTGVQVNWKFFSLEEINRLEGKKHPWERRWSYGWAMIRVGAYLRRKDPALLDQWYQVAGRALHVEGRKPHRQEVAEHLLTQMGLDPAWVEAAIDDPTTTDEVRAEHDRCVALGAWGVPLLVFDDDQAFFGPVLINPPTSEAAVTLWNAVTAWREFPNVYEFQRPKRQADIHAIGEAFRPYLEAHDWITIQNETP